MLGGESIFENCDIQSYTCLVNKFTEMKMTYHGQKYDERFYTKLRVVNVFGAEFPVSFYKYDDNYVCVFMKDGQVKSVIADDVKGLEQKLGFEIPDFIVEELERED